MNTPRNPRGLPLADAQTLPPRRVTGTDTPLLARDSNTLALVYLMIVTGAEALTVFLDHTAGIAAHSLVLIALLVHSSINPERPVSKVLLALTLAPLIRILSLASPLFPFPQIYWYLVIGAPLLTAAYVVVRNLNLKWGDIGFTPRNLPLQFLIAFLGIPLGFMENFILKPDPLIGSLTLGHLWLPALILLVSTGFAEEFIFRGVLQRVTRPVFGSWNLLFVSTLFAVLHLGYYLRGDDIIYVVGTADVIFVFLVGFLFSVIVKKTGSLLGVTLAHGLTNIFLYLIVPLL